MILKRKQTVNLGIFSMIPVLVGEVIIRYVTKPMMCQSVISIMSVITRMLSSITP